MRAFSALCNNPDASYGIHRAGHRAVCGICRNGHITTHAHTLPDLPACSEHRRTHGYTVAETYGYPLAETYRDTNAETHGNTNTKTHGCSYGSTYGNPDSDACSLHRCKLYYACRRCARANCISAIK